MRATTVNRTDCGALWGRPFVYRFFVGFPRPRCAATGTDFAGDVIAVGHGVTAFQVGDRVWGFDDNVIGSHAQYMTYGADLAIAKIPSGVSYEHAVASLEGAHYAISFISKVRLQSGQRVLVNGATGAIGSAAVQLLKERGVHVTAVCGPDQVERVAAALGPDRVIDYASQDFTKEDTRYDFVLDAVGKSTFGRCRRVLDPRGIYVSSELGPWGQNVWFALLAPLSNGRKVIFPLPTNVKGSIALMSRLLEEGKFQPLIDRRYPIEQIREAFSTSTVAKRSATSSSHWTELETRSRPQRVWPPKDPQICLSAANLCLSNKESSASGHSMG